MNPATKNQVIYAGTFDPPTRGHLDVIQRGCQIFEKVIVAVAEDTSKNMLFTVEERVGLCAEITRDLAKVEVESFGGLLVHYAREKGISTILRGMRPGLDFEHEFRMALANRKLAPEMDTLFLMSSAEHLYVSSSVVKEIASMGGDVCSLVPEVVKRALAEKFGGEKERGL